MRTARVALAAACAATQCIGVRATVDLTAIKGAIDKVQLGNLSGLLAKIQPAVDAASYDGEHSAKNDGFVDAVARKNVELTIPALTLAPAGVRSPLLSLRSRRRFAVDNARLARPPN